MMYKIDADFIEMHIATPYYGTELHEIAKAEGLIDTLDDEGIKPTQGLIDDFLDSFVIHWKINDEGRNFWEMVHGHYRVTNFTGYSWNERYSAVVHSTVDIRGFRIVGLPGNDSP